jgi:putative intracellular protease/amidase
LDIAIPIFDGLTALDAVGPYEVLSRLPDAHVTFVAQQRGPKRTDSGMLAITADRTLDELPEPEIIVMPGGLGNRPLIRDESFLAWIRHAHETSLWTTSVCTGSLVLAAAGILDGVDATTHWLARDELAALGARPVDERVVRRGKVITAAGVSAGIDMALTLAAQIAGDNYSQAIQLGIEYDPEPPFVGGSVSKAPPEIVARVRGASSTFS